MSPQSAKKAPAKKASKKPSAFKQKGMMSFFKPKKK